MIKVVIVDDEPWNREFIRNLGDWEKLGMEVAAEADDGLEAIRILDTIQPQIVIMDMRMPGVDGVRLLELLHDRHMGIRSIVVSGYDDFIYTKNAIRYKAMDYLLKPVDPQELNAALAKCKSEIENAYEKNKTLAPDPEWSRRIALFKQTLAYHFNDLNASSVRGMFAQLEQEQRLADDESSGALSRLVEELHVLLHILLVENGIEDELAQLFNETLLTNHPSKRFIFATISEAYLQALDRLVLQRKFKNKLNLEEVRQFIDRHFEEALSLERLARLFFVSKEYLSKAFKQRYNRNVTDYVLEVRMNKARMLLLDEQLSIKSVAEMTGYEDISYFHRVFKKYFGVAPGEMLRTNEV